MTYHDQPQGVTPQFAQPPQQTFQPQPTQESKPKLGTLSVVSLALSFFVFGLPAVIIGVLALKQNTKMGYRGNGMAWAGIIIGSVHWVAAFAIAYFLIVMIPTV